MTWQTAKSRQTVQNEKRASKFWTCYKCQYQWCFMTRQKCYKCNASKPTSQPSPASQRQQAGTPPAKGNSLEGPSPSPSPPVQKTQSLLDYANAPLMLAKQTGISIPSLMQEDHYMAPSEEVVTADKTEVSDPTMEQRKMFRASIEKHEAIIKLLDPDLDQGKIQECERQIQRDKQSISSLKPLPQRIESLQKVVDSQWQRIARANQVISNWELLRDAWQQKHDGLNAELLTLKKQQAEQQAALIGSTLDSGGKELQLSQLQLQSQQLLQLLQGILAAATTPSIDQALLCQELTKASQMMNAIDPSLAPVQTIQASPPKTFPAAPPSLGSIGTFSPEPPGGTGIYQGPTPLGPPISQASVPTPARAPIHRSPASSPPPHARRKDRSRSPLASDAFEQMTMDDAQRQDDQLLAAESALHSAPAPKALFQSNSPTAIDMAAAHTPAHPA